jgi:molecular chaperone HtpG
MAEERLGFQAEVSKLLDIVAHSLYSEKEVFLRELISNASDACDRLRYEALTKPELLAGDPGLRVTIEIDKPHSRLTVADNGIGMSRQELIDNLGTIARSGTAAFVKDKAGAKDQAGQATGNGGAEEAGERGADRRDDLALIGQFGVGFYSAFMVADLVEVVSRKAGEAEAFRWSSDGKGSFTVAEAELQGRGTRITLHMTEAGQEFLEPERIRQIVKRYSDHIALPVELLDGAKRETLNAASALWTRPKSEITELQYKEFYRHVAHSFDDPWMTLHYRAEGKLDYSALLFVPSHRPFDLFNPDRKGGLRLYVKRVFITDDCPELLPPYLRFLRGIVDSEDLPLNVSREMLQKNPLLARIRQGLVKRLLDQLEKKAKEDPADYALFWENFGAVLKEGLYEDAEQRERLLALVRFRSTASEGWTSLGDYLGRMKEGQEAIFTIAGETQEGVARSPQLEGFRAKGIEVLLLTDPVDEFWMPAVGAYKSKPFKSVTRGGADLDKIKAGAETKPEAAEASSDVSGLVALFKLALKDAVKDVRTSERLTDSPVCLVADEGDMDMHLERLLRQHKQLERQSRRILELNPKHPLIKRLAARVKEQGAEAQLSDYAFLLLDQARIVEGETPPDPAAFSRRLASLLEQGLGA